jgi:hypothetical protein
MSENKSILTAHPIAAVTAPSLDIPEPQWDVAKFESLIYRNGYDAYIERAFRCPCVDRSSGQALATCQNCLGRGWFFVDKRKTKVVSQSLANLRKNSDIGEINRGTARITTRAIDRLAFMDKIILTELLAWFTEILRPIYIDDELTAYPVYEPLEVSNMYLFIDDTSKLKPISNDLYRIEGNRIVFDESILELIGVTDVNQKQPDISISVRYSYNPVYHVIDVNRELMKVRDKGCTFSDEKLKNMPISALARKAHYIFDQQLFGRELFDNTIIED